MSKITVKEIKNKIKELLKSEFVTDEEKENLKELIKGKKKKEELALVYIGAIDKIDERGDLDEVDTSFIDFYNDLIELVDPEEEVEEEVEEETRKKLLSTVKALAIAIKDGGTIQEIVDKMMELSGKSEKACKNAWSLNSPILKHLGLIEKVDGKFIWKGN